MNKENTNNGNVEEKVEEKVQEQTVENTDKTAGQEAAETTPAEENWQEKFEKTNDSYLRLMADFDNFRKKTLKEKSDLIKYGGEKVFIDLLPVIDDFERALAAMPEGDDPVKNGVVLIYNKFIEFLKKNGVTEIEAKGIELDTDCHDAVAMFPTQDEAMKGKIIDCTQKGYKYNDKVIRCAKVVVGQ